MKTTIDRQKASLIKKYHTLCGKLGMTDEQKREMLDSNYGVVTSKHLHLDELKHLCQSLEDSTKKPNVEADRMDKQRKKLLALIYQFCEARGYACDKVLVKRIACNACKVKSFNEASEQKLIAAIQRFDRNLIDIAVNELVESCINYKNKEYGKEKSNSKNGNLRN